MPYDSPRAKSQDQMTSGCQRRSNFLERRVEFLVCCMSFCDPKEYVHKSNLSSSRLWIAPCRGALGCSAWRGIRKLNPCDVVTGGIFMSHRSLFRIALFVRKDAEEADRTRIHLCDR